MLRWALQIFVMTFDIVLIAAAVFLLAEEWENPLVWLLVMYCMWVWVKQGAFMAWNPKTVRRFMRNARDSGL